MDCWELLVCAREPLEDLVVDLDGADSWGVDTWGR